MESASADWWAVNSDDNYCIVRSGHTCDDCSNYYTIVKSFLPPRLYPRFRKFTSRYNARTDARGDILLCGCSTWSLIPKTVLCLGSAALNPRRRPQENRIIIIILLQAAQLSQADTTGTSCGQFQKLRNCTVTVMIIQFDRLKRVRVLLVHVNT